MTPRDIVLDLLRRLQEAGHEAYLVGGCVRDELRGMAPQDYDMATSARPEEVEALFPQTHAVGKSFGVILVLEHGYTFEVATFRAESDYTDGRRPNTVTFSDAQTDASRRDFTVNGLFMDPLTDTVHDWVGGQEDLEKRRLRTIGHPTERFNEDHLRLLRAVRLAAQLDFEIDPATFAAVRDMADHITRVSAERVRDELLKLFRPPYAARGLDLLHESGLLAQVLPELLPTVTCEQSPDYHPEGTVYDHIRLMLSKLPAEASVELPWTALLHDIAKPVTQSECEEGRIHFYGHEKIGADMAQQILQRLRFPNVEIEAIVQTVRYHMQFKDAPKMRKATLRRMLMRPTFELELEQHRLDCLGSHGLMDIYDFIREQQTVLQEKPLLLEPLISGRDLIELGIEPGPALGQLLDAVRDQQLAETFSTREEALAWAKEKADL
jgi:poly(A) polymerase